MKIIGFRDIQSLSLSPADCFGWVSEMIACKNDSLLPPKTHMELPGNVFCNVMPCILKKEGASKWGGVKIVNRYPERIPSLDSRILLLDTQTGEFLALMDGNWITAMRTGAVAAHSVVTFAKPGFTTVSLIGLGNVARAALLVLDAVLQRPLTVKLLRYKDQAEDFEKRFREHPNLHFSIVDSVEDCVRGSEVILSCATYFENDIARDEWFDEGVLLVPVHTRGFTNCDLFFDKVFADDTGHVDHFKNFSKFRRYAEVSDVVNQRSPGRENNKERILAYNIGISVHDINYAGHIYQAFESRPELFRRLKDADLHTPDQKFWV